MAFRRTFGLFIHKPHTRSIYSCSEHTHLEQYAKDHGHVDSLFGLHHHPHRDIHHPHHSERFFHAEAREMSKHTPSLPVETKQSEVVKVKNNR